MGFSKLILSGRMEKGMADKETVLKGRGKEREEFDNIKPNNHFQKYFTISLHLHTFSVKGD